MFSENYIDPLQRDNRTSNEHILSCHVMDDHLLNTDRLEPKREKEDFSVWQSVDMADKSEDNCREFERSQKGSLENERHSSNLFLDSGQISKASKELRLFEADNSGLNSVTQRFHAIEETIINAVDAQRAIEKKLNKLANQISLSSKEIDVSIPKTTKILCANSDQALCEMENVLIKIKDHVVRTKVMVNKILTILQNRDMILWTMMVLTSIIVIKLIWILNHHDPTIRYRQPY